ncbi:MAG TPA: ribonuclease J [Vicinamibacteria bacterium]|nr:ribonuclease J [Vicinamibacteria bacterium]
MSGQGTLRLIPLGGLGEFGLNAMVLEWQDHLLLIDAGVMFPGGDSLGVDSIVPDFEYLRERAARLRGIVLTHGHEDHIGALSFALQAAPAPVFASRLALGFARERLAERGATADMRELRPGQAVEAGPFRLHPIRVAHSVHDSLALAIETPAGVVLTTGDFKIDRLARGDEATDLEALSAWGERGVLVLLSDSTNVEQRGASGCEDDVIPAFRDILARTRGRLLVSCFATSTPRMQRVCTLAEEASRSVAFLGRRMAGNSAVARELGYLNVSDSSLLPADFVGDHPAPGLLAFVSGSQGEPMSALSMISVGEHPLLGVGPGDTVVLAARPIPGNERSVSRLIGNLMRRGCEVMHPATAHVHVSGHAGRDDLLEVMARVRPRYLVPIHGEYRMLAQHGRLAVEAGLGADRVLVAEDGEVLAFDERGARKEGRAEAGRVLLDRSGLEGVEDVVLRDRRHLSAEGIVVPVIVLDKATGGVGSPPEIVTRGFVDAGGVGAGVLDEAARLVLEAVEARPLEERHDPTLLRERVRAELRRFFKKRTQRRPMVIPVVMEV